MCLKLENKNLIARNRATQSLEVYACIANQSCRSASSLWFPVAEMDRHLFFTWRSINLTREAVGVGVLSHDVSHSFPARASVERFEKQLEPESRPCSPKCYLRAGEGCYPSLYWSAFLEAFLVKSNLSCNYLTNKTEISYYVFSMLLKWYTVLLNKQITL